jgi:hypothetical protein
MCFLLQSYREIRKEVLPSLIVFMLYLDTGSPLLRASLPSRLLYLARYLGILCGYKYILEVSVYMTPSIQCQAQLPQVQTASFLISWKT